MDVIHIIFVMKSCIYYSYSPIIWENLQLMDSICNIFVNSLFIDVLYFLTQVAGLVGRADLLCALFFLLSFMAYVKTCTNGKGEKSLFLIS